MKIILSLLLCLLLTACGQTQKNQENTSIPQENTQIEVEDEVKTKDPSVDIDLTALSGTVVYAEVYNMMTVPEDYIGKKVKMKGSFYAYTNPTTGKNYYSCIITDALACCSQDLEFVLAGEHNYPEDYPELESEITVIGEFQSYERNGYNYLSLVNAVLE